MKFTLFEGTIEIKTKYCYENRQLIVGVKDSGVGISQEDIEKLFTHFGKLKRTQGMNHEGIGLGLIIVKKIIEELGGTIKVESEGIGKGCLFQFSLPLELAQDEDNGR